MNTRINNQQHSLEAMHEKPSIAPFSVVRIGGVSAHHLEPLLLKRTSASIVEAQQFERCMQELVPSVEDALYRLVPLVGEQKELRRRILAVKRNVHNLRIWESARQDVELVVPAMGVDGALLSEWFRLAQLREDALQAAAVAYEEELVTANATIARGVADEYIQQGLALASPDLLKELQRSIAEEEWRPTSKLARSSLSYLTRAALKTSPLSTFTRIGVADFVAPSSAIPVKQVCSAQEDMTSREKLHRVVRLVRMLPTALLTLIARNPDLAPLLHFEPNKGITRAASEPDKLRVLSNHYYITGDFAGRAEATVDHEIRRGVARNFLAFLESGRRVTYQELLTLLPRGRKEKDPHQRMLQLLDKQLFRPVAPFTRRDEQPLLELAKVLERGTYPLAASLAGYIRALQQAVDASKDANGFERLQLLESIREHATGLFVQLGVPAPDWLKNNLLYEDVEHRGSIRIPSQVQEDLIHVANLLRPRMKRMRLYDYLYQDFVQRFGSDGETDDILGFFTDFLKREDASELIARAASDDHTRLKDETSKRNNLPAGESAVPPAVTVLYQLAAENQQALERGDYKLIVNQVLSDEGGLLGRFDSLLDAEHGDLVGKLRNWSTNSLYKGRNVVEMPLVGDWHNLQGERNLTEQTLRWPAETPTDGDNERTLELRDLRLRANARDETLYFVDAQNRGIAPAYFGVVPMHLFTREVRLMLTLIHPWINDYDVGWQATGPNVNTVVPTQVEFFPRREEGRIVLRRARWRFPPELIPVRQKGEGDFEFFARMQRWREEHQLPEELFVSTDRPKLSFEAKVRKPIWINFRSPHTLELLRQYVDKDAIAVCFTEALPARQQYWLASDKAIDVHSGHASEFMTQLHWPMPCAEKPGGIHVPVLGNITRNSWLYFKIYPHSSDQLDEVIRFIVRPTVELVRSTLELERWFFIRYMDQRGWHIRLRLRGPFQEHKEVYHKIGDLIERALPGLPYQKRGRILPAYLSPPVRLGESGYKITEYQPEYQKYGGRTGILIAERLFEASSELAVQAVMRSPLLDLRRVLLSLHLMQVVINTVFDTAEERTHFLNHYHWYWGGQNREEGKALQSTFRQSAYIRRGPLIEQLANDLKDPVVQMLIEDYQKAVTETVQALHAAIDELSESIDHMCFDYVHMNNNRLGIVPFEESYLSALLLEINSTDSAVRALRSRKEELHATSRT
ncbi:MAG: thiopeptide-type bacteriocin biosynthesis protein [Ktedonobacteraceae bacterium]|nr:thiopeptide-type bacteriocin biosynthesis protein [Ktedonobacteraceae bacterium]